MQNSVIRIWITSIYWSLPSSVVYTCKTVTFGPEIQVFICPRPQLSFCACKTGWFATEWQVYMGSSRHLWFLHSKQRLLDQNTSLPGPQTSSVVLCIQNSDFKTRIPWLYGSQPLSVVLCIQKSDIRTRIACHYGSHTSPVILCLENGVPSIRITSLCGLQPSSVVFGCKTSILDQNNKSLWVTDITCHFVHAKQHD